MLLWSGFILVTNIFCSDSRIHPEACNKTGEALGHVWKIDNYSSKLEDYAKNTEFAKQKDVIIIGTMVYLAYKKEAKLTIYHKDQLAIRLDTNMNTQTNGLTFSWALK